MLKAFAALRQGAGRLRCSFVVLNHGIGTLAAASSLTLDGQIPLVGVLPADLLPEQRVLLQRQRKVLFCPWEEALGTGPNSLYRVVEGAFAERGIGDLFRDLQRLPYERMQRGAKRPRLG